VHLLHLAALRQLGERDEDAVEVGQVVQHRRLEEIGVADPKVVVAHVQEELDVLAAQELQWMERRFRFNSRGSYTKGSSKFNNSIGHTYFKVFVFNFLTNSIFKFSKY